MATACSTVPSAREVHPNWDAARILLLGFIALIGFPVRYYPLGTGIDPSWAFAVNYAHARGLIFGQDVGFTYGPLAWLALPMDVGGNLWPAVLFQLVCWIAFIAAVAWLVRDVPTGRMLAFTVCLAAGMRSFDAFDFAGPEIFLAFLGLLLLGGAATSRHGQWFHAAAWAIGVLLLSVKFSAGMMVTGAAAIFPLGLWVRDRRMAWTPVVAAALGVSALFAGGYLLYYPSPAALLRYLRSGLEVSSGYSAAMSLAGSSAPLVLAAGLVLSWLVLLIHLYRRRDRTFPLAVAFLAPLFLIFKHSFVREPGHLGLIFAFAPLLWAILLLLSQVTWRSLAPLLLLPAVISLVTAVPAGVKLERFRNALELLHPAKLRSRLADQSRQALAADKLPGELLARVGAETVAIFPYECAYAASNLLNFRPFPVLQAYSAYTPYLDAWDAAFLEDQGRAPRFILFDWQAIDERHPLLDVPATALAMYRNYEAEGRYGPHLLLRRRPQPRAGVTRLVDTRELRLGELFTPPASSNLLTARIYLRLTPAGRLRNFLFRIPEVRLRSTEGLSVRVAPDVIADGIPLNFMPRTLEEWSALLSGNMSPGPAGQFAIEGAGARFYEARARVEVFEIAGLP